MSSSFNPQATIVIADDDQDILEILQVVLCGAGFNVHLSWNANNIEKTIVEVNPDLILLDIQMQGIDGGELCKQLRNPPHSVTIPIVMISANHNLEQVALECQASGYIAKPFTPSSLIAKIQGFLDNSGN